MQFASNLTALSGWGWISEPKAKLSNHVTPGSVQNCSSRSELAGRTERSVLLSFSSIWFYALHSAFAVRGHNHLLLVNSPTASPSSAPQDTSLMSLSHWKSLACSSLGEESRLPLFSVLTWYISPLSQTSWKWQDEPHLTSPLIWRPAARKYIVLHVSWASTHWGTHFP